MLKCELPLRPATHVSKVMMCDHCINTRPFCSSEFLRTLDMFFLTYLGSFHLSEQIYRYAHYTFLRFISYLLDMING